MSQLKTAYNDPNYDLSAISDSDAQRLADDLWKVPSSHRVDTDWSRYRKVLSELAITRDIVPSSFILRDVHYTGRTIGSFQGAKVALKRLPAYSDARREYLKQLLLCELILWKSLAHKYIVPILGISESVGVRMTRRNRRLGTYAVTPWMENESLREYADSQRRQCLLVGDEEEISAVNKWLYQILDGLAYLHSEGIVHGNIHGNNILVDDSGNACLTDYGWASLGETVNTYDELEFRITHRLRYTAPEVIDPNFRLGDDDLEPSRRAPASDIFSFACVCIELYTGKPPLSDSMTKHQIRAHYIKGRRSDRPILRDGRKLPYVLWSLVKHCWAQHPANRPTSQEAQAQLAAIMILSSQDLFEPGRLLEKTQGELQVTKAELNAAKKEEYRVTKHDMDAVEHEREKWAIKEKMYTSHIAILELQLANLSKTLESEKNAHTTLQTHHTEQTREFEKYRLTMRSLNEQILKGVQEQAVLCRDFQLPGSDQLASKKRS